MRPASVEKTSRPIWGSCVSALSMAVLVSQMSVKSNSAFSQSSTLFAALAIIWKNDSMACAACSMVSMMSFPSDTIALPTAMKISTAEFARSMANSQILAAPLLIPSQTSVAQATKSSQKPP
jgi:hypothetical protein